MLKYITICSFLFIIGACKPIEEQSNNNSENNLNAAINAQCIASQSECNIVTELASFSVKFAQEKLDENVKAELPFYIELSYLPADKASEIAEETMSISAHIEGRDMFMGKVPVFFLQTSNENTFQAKSLLASCMEEYMVWRLWVKVEMSGKEESFFVDFTVKNS